MFSLQKVLRSPTISKITFRPLSNLPHFSISEEVQHALNNNLPLVALESTIITHGMPYPKNVECALGVEEQIRQKGALPATVAILDGKIRVGLTEAEVMKLGELRDEVVKTSRRDIAYVVANKLNGGTTVSGTLLVCNKVGIPIFATGGIGGVHRLGEQTLDISADLTELGKSGVAVFSSGAKSILDIPKTLEYLETQGVFVATYGDTTEFPAFYCRKSGHRVPYRIQSPVDAAKIILANRSCSLHSGMLFGVPVPKENALDEKEIDEIIRKALILANKEDVTGKNVTPFLLARVSEATKGRSLATTLVKNNAKIAAEVAVELSRIKKDNGRVMGAFGAKKESGKKQPVVIGGSVLDRCIRILDSDITLGSHRK